LLQNAELLLKGQLIGPESIIVEGNTLYTGTTDGKIVKIVNGVITKTVLLSDHKDCQTLESRLQNLHLCGRPLGMRRKDKDTIIVADCYLGILSVDVEKGTKKVLLPGGTIIEGKPLLCADDCDFINEDTIVFSDASTKYDYHHFIHDFVENGPNGRVIQLQLSTGEAKVLVDGLHFANGVQLMPDKQSFLVNEMGMAQITRYYIAGPRKGEREIFMKNLPFYPDNIRLNSHGTFYVSSAFPRHPEKFLFWEFLGPYPTIRRLLLQLIPSTLLGKFFGVTSVEHGLVIEVDTNGKILSSLHDPTGVVRETSQVTDDGEFLYIASFHRDFIAKIRKPKVK